MGLSIKNEATERRARALAALTGESLTGAIDRALQERLDRLSAAHTERVGALDAVIAAFRALPVLDAGDPDTLFDDLYDANGLPR